MDNVKINFETVTIHNFVYLEKLSIKVLSLSGSEKLHANKEAYLILAINP